MSYTVRIKCRKEESKEQVEFLIRKALNKLRKYKHTANYKFLYELHYKEECDEVDMEFRIYTVFIPSEMEVYNPKNEGYIKPSQKRIV